MQIELYADKMDCPICGNTNTSLFAPNPLSSEDCLIDFYFCKNCGYVEYKNDPNDECYYFGVYNKSPYMEERFYYLDMIQEIMEEVGEFWIGGKAGEWLEKNAEVYKEYLEREEGVRI